MLFKSLIISKLSLNSINSSINKNIILSNDETFKNTIVSTNSTSQVFTRPHYVGY
ncbi:hypothetical protein RB653_009159 [Dictyostelium firmibasis]|uniref:Uncharacterized protein n=1 Tax=Dictyostelium firmibasis TaxID=79012 RepID=A0AAN7U1H9_9MYCE